MSVACGHAAEEQQPAILAPRSVSIISPPDPQIYSISESLWDCKGLLFLML
jgi:hypothetical protein